MASVTCQSCRKPKDKVVPVKSRLLPTTLLLCESCKEAGYEPRYSIIIAAHSKPTPDQRKLIDTYIKRRLYVGADILASELL